MAADQWRLTAYSNAGTIVGGRVAAKEITVAGEGAAAIGDERPASDGGALQVQVGELDHTCQASDISSYDGLLKVQGDERHSEQTECADIA